MTYVNYFIENGERPLIFPDLRVNIFLDLDEDLNDNLLKGFENVLFHNVDTNILYVCEIPVLYSIEKTC